MISIIIPVFNAEQYLNKLFESLVSQTNKDFEVIMVDDGSTDNSLEICREYASKDSRFKVIHQVNSGVGAARNNGLKAASGQWITFIDSDDYIEPEYLNIGNDSSIDLYMQNWSVFGGAVVKPEHLDAGRYKGRDMKRFLAENMYMDIFRMVCCKFYKKSIIEENNIKFLPQFRIGEDTLFMLEYMKYASAIQVMDTGDYKYFRPSNWGAKYRLRIDDAVVFFDAFICKYKSQPYSCWKLLEFMVNWYPNVIEDFNINMYKWFSSQSVKYAQNKTIIHKGLNSFISLIKIRLRILYAQGKCHSPNIWR